MQAESPITSAVLHAESAVLGSMLRDPRCAADVLARLKATDFMGPRHAGIFKVLGDLEARAMCSTDPVTVEVELSNRGKAQELGGREYLIQLMESVPSIAFLENHVESVQIASRRRELQSLIRTAQAKLEGDFETDLVARELDGGITDLLATESSSAPVSMADAVRDLQADLQRRIELDKAPGQIQTPVGALNQRLGGGLYAPELVVVGARPAMGKTFWAECVAERACMEGAVLFVSLEMTAYQIAERGVRRHIQAEIPRLKKLHGTLAKQALDHTYGPARLLSQQRINFLDNAGADFSSIRSAAIRMKRDGGLVLLIIDYLQLIPITEPSGSRQEDVANLSRRFKLLAKELNIPILLLSQLNRGSEKREGKRPSLSDLRESGAIEQDADTVMLLHRPGYYDEDYVGPDLILVEKSRHGESGTVKAHADLSHLRWSDYAPEVRI